MDLENSHVLPVEKHLQIYFTKFEGALFFDSIIVAVSGAIASSFC